MGGMSPSLMSQTFRDDVFSYYSTYILYTISNTRWVFGSEQLRPTVENHHETPCRTGWPGKVKIGTDVAASEFYKSDEKARFEISVLSFSGGRRCCGWIEDGMAGSVFIFGYMIYTCFVINSNHQSSPLWRKWWEENGTFVYFEPFAILNGEHLHEQRLFLRLFSGKW